MRSLTPYFFVSTHPVGWKCSTCGQIFRIPLNVLGAPTSKLDEDVRSRFEAHSCLAYRDEFQKRRGEASTANDTAPDSGDI
jgi:hypothetical protein